MTFQEYLNQKDPKRLPIGSVKLKKEDCFTIYKHYNIKTVGLKMFGNYYTYRANENGTLYTTDENGTFNKPSVFRLEEKE